MLSILPMEEKYVRLLPNPCKKFPARASEKIQSTKNTGDTKETGSLFMPFADSALTFYTTSWMRDSKSYRIRQSPSPPG